MPINHKDACSDSKCLCDQIFETLKERDDAIQRKSGDNYCDLLVGRRFAYIAHSKRKPHLNIWFLGSAEKAQKYEGLRIKPRTKTAGNWNDWGGSFTVSDAQQAEQAANLLFSISYPIPPT
jgi:hypothetical protein